MNKLFAIALFFVFAVSAGAQTKFSYSTTGESDPEAKVILDKLRKKFESYKTLAAGFTLRIEFPEEAPIIQTGTLSQAGDKFRVDLSDQSIISDGKVLWLHQIENQEVQINNADDMGEDDLMTPKGLLTIYEKDNFIYALSNQFMENGIPVQQIEFKPTDKDSEYAKIRLTVDKNKSEIVRIKAFSKDGSRFTFELNNLEPNKAFENDFFQFDPKKYPGIHIEDLRID